MRERLLLRLTAALLVRSMRWVAPAVLTTLAVLLIIANPGPPRANGVAGYAVVLLTACWLSVVIGNLDDDGHREMCTAIVGSPGRLVITRSLAALAMCAPVAALIALALTLAGTPKPTIADGTAVLGLQLAGALAGVGIGSVLHRPLVRHAGVTVLAASAALLACSVTPPIVRLLREASDGGSTAVLVLIAAATALCATSIAITARITSHFAR